METLLGFNIMSRFQTQEDILKLIDEEDDEFVDIPSGAESEDDEEVDDEREENGNDTHDSRATMTPILKVLDGVRKKNQNPLEFLIKTLVHHRL
jgi:hypothetical protein